MPTELETLKQQFHSKINSCDNSDNEDEDVLSVYFSYISSLAKLSSCDMDAAKELETVLQYTTEKFKEDDIYKNDLRYLKIWMMRIKSLPRDQAIACFDQLFQAQIGVNYSTYWEEKASVLGESALNEGLQYFKATKNTKQMEKLRSKFGLKELKENVASNNSAPVSTLIDKKSEPSGASKRKEVRAYNLQYPKDEFGKENSFEEIRAQHYFSASLSSHERSRNESCVNEVDEIMNMLSITEAPSEHFDRDEARLQQELEKTCTIVQSLPVQKLVYGKLQVYRDPTIELKKPLPQKKTVLKVKDVPVEHDAKPYAIEESIESILNLQTPGRPLFGENPDRPAATHDFDLNSSPLIAKFAAEGSSKPVQFQERHETSSRVLEWPNFEFQQTLVASLQEDLEGVVAVPNPVPAFNNSSKLPFDLILGETHVIITKKLGHDGKFGSVYLADMITEEPDEDNDELELSDMIHQVAIKIESPVNRWEYLILSMLHSQMSVQGHEDQIRFLKANQLFYDSDKSYLFMQYGGKFSLLDAVNYYKKQGMTNSAVSGMEEALVMFFVVELLKMLKALHSSAVVHTDIRMENILLRFPSPSENKIPWDKQYDDSDDAWKQRGLLLIDFGRAIQSGLLDSSISHLKLLNPVPSHKGKEDIFEKRLEVPWSWDVDLVGMAGIIYCLIFSEPLYYKGKEALSSNSDLNTQWNGETWFNVIKEKRFQRSWLKDEFWIPLFELLLVKYSSVSVEDYQSQSDFSKKSFRFNGDQKVQHLQDLDKFEQIAKGYLREWTSKSSGVCLKTLLRKLEINLLNK